MDKHTVWAWAIKNSICVMCWVALAIFFGKWWIALFGLLFMSDLKTGGTCRICDSCGKHSPLASTKEEALKKAKEAGWSHYELGNIDYCEECAKHHTFK